MAEAATILWQGVLALGLWALVVLAAGRSGQVDRLGRMAVIAAPVLILAVTGGGLVFADDIVAETLRPALIAALVVVTGWFVTFLFQETRQAEERRSDQVDLMTALRAEIWIFVANFNRADTEAALEDLSTRLDQALHDGADYLPFLTLDAEPVIFDALAGQVQRLPGEIVDPVIQFYSLLTDVRQFALDLREPSFTGLPLARRDRAYRDYFEMRLTLGRLGNQAIYAINCAMQIDRPGEGLDLQGMPRAQAGADDDDLGARAAALREWINSRAADPDGRGSGRDVSDHGP